MARNGSGTFSLVAGNPVVVGTTISSTTHNNTNTDIATALTNSIAANGETPITANIPFGNYRITGLGVGTAAGDAANVGQVQAHAYDWCGTAGGTANALTLTPSPAITAYAAGQTFRFKSGAAPNSAATTVAISGLSTIAVQVNGAACAGAEIAASHWYQITLDSATTCQLVGLGRPALADLATNATNLTGSGAVSATATGGAGLTPTNATNATNADNLTGAGTVSTNTTGGDNLTPLRLKSTSRYASGSKTMVANTRITMAHGLAGRPNLLTFWYLCVTGENGYSAGDYVSCVSAGNTASTGFSAQADATNIYVVFSANQQVIDQSAHTTNNLDLTKWVLVVEAAFL